MAEPRPALPAIHEMDFHGDRLLLIDVDSKPHIVLRPALEALGLDYSGQLQRLQRQPWAVVGMTPTTGTDGKTYQMVTVPVRTFLMMLATVDAGRVTQLVRPKLIAYQSEVADAIEAYWTNGAAINPRATADQLHRVIDICAKQVGVLQGLAGIVDSAWLEAMARHVAARALGVEPEVDPARRPLTVGEYLEEKGVRGAQLRKLRGNFGRWLKRAYEAEFGDSPQSVERFVDGALRDVRGYTEAHRPLFDAVWAERCEGRMVDAPVVRLPNTHRGRREWPA